MAHVLQEGLTLTPDLGGRSGTKAVGEAVARALEIVEVEEGAS